MHVIARCNCPLTPEQHLQRCSVQKSHSIALWGSRRVYLPCMQVSALVIPGIRIGTLISLRDVYNSDFVNLMYELYSSRLMWYGAGCSMGALLYRMAWGGRGRGWSTSLSSTPRGTVEGPL